MPLDGYTDIGNVDQGDSTDPAYGDGIRANEAAFAGYLQSGSIVQASSTQVQVKNTTTETAVMTYTVPGNKLSTDNVYRFEIHLKLENTHSSAENVTFKLKYGSTTVATAGAISAAATTVYYVIITGILGANAATNAQWGALRVTRTNAAVSNEGGDEGSAAEDSTGDLDLVVTATWGTANAGYTLTKYFNTVTYHEP